MDAPNRWLFVPLHSGRGYRGKAGVPDPSTPQNEKKELSLFSHARVTESAPVMRRSRA